MKLVEPPRELAETVSPIAVYLAEWMGEERLILVFTRRDQGGRVYVAPPIPSPFCQRVRDSVDGLIVKHVLTRYNLGYVSACMVEPSLYSASLRETLRNIAEALELKLVEEAG